MTTSPLQTATLAGGCFWCTEAIFQRFKGVKSVMPGYTGGDLKDPTYEQVSNGNTGHAESLQISFDPSVIPYQKLLEIFWHLHDPTTYHRQGADVGPQYRSAIFYHTDEQKDQALQSKNELERSGYYKHPIVTEIVPFTSFYPAEPYHRNFYNRNQESPYCQFVIDPKLQKLMKEFKDEVKSSS